MTATRKPLGSDYRRLLTSSIISNLGDGVSVIAYPWLASAVTRNPLHIAAVAVATRLPWLIVTLPAGVITDRGAPRGVVRRFGAVGFSDEALVVAAMMAIDGFLAMLWNVITVAFRQSIIPNRLLGRVNSVYRLFSWGAIPIGGLIGGLIVVVTEGVTDDRELALRMPFFFTAVSCVALLGLALPRIGTAQLEAARAAAAGPIPEGDAPRS